MYIRQSDLEETQLLRKKEKSVSKRGILLGLSLLALVLIGIYLFIGRAQSPIQDEEDHAGLKKSWSPYSHNKNLCTKACENYYGGEVKGSFTRRCYVNGKKTPIDCKKQGIIKCSWLANYSFSHKSIICKKACENFYHGTLHGIYTHTCKFGGKNKNCIDCGHGK